jgi:uncharacterized protein
MLELRPNCEHCDTDLPPSSLDARICTFECTFCATCADDLLGGVCPNCTGELLPRPVRPEALLDGAPAATARVHAPVDLEAHRAMLAGRVGTDDHAGVVLRRYADAWRGGDLDQLLGCYGDDFTLHYGGTSRFAGTHVGKDAAVSVMVDVSTVAPRELVDIDHLLVGDGAGALVVTERLVRDGESAEVSRTLLYEVSGGRLTACRLLEHDRATVDHFWR